MRHTQLVLLALVLTTSTAQADTVYRCTNEHGRAVFSDQPCGDNAKVETIEPAPMMGSNSSMTGFYQRMADQGLKDATRTQLLRAIDEHQTTIANLRATMNAKLQELDTRQSYANNNLAGAVYGQQLATDKQVVVDKYNALIASQEAELTRLHNRLDQESAPPDSHTSADK